jgi:hypothetical protein
MQAGPSYSSVPVTKKHSPLFPLWLVVAREVTVHGGHLCLLRESVVVVQRARYAQAQAHLCMILKESMWSVSTGSFV